MLHPLETNPELEPRWLTKHSAKSQYSANEFNTLIVKRFLPWFIYFRLVHPA
jgi:hypothetical protein